MQKVKNSFLLFESVFREHYNPLANYAYSFLKDKDDAEDVVQSVFVKIWENHQVKLEDDGIKFYLYTAVKNGCLTKLKKTVTVPLTGDVAAEEPVFKNNLPEDISNLISEAFRQLPPQCLVIFKMSRFGKLKYAEIAAELGLSVKTVENQMGKALKIMREFAKSKNISFSLLLFFLLFYRG